MIKQLEELELNALKELEGIGTNEDLESWRVHYLGKKSELTGILRSLVTLPIDERKTLGARANQVKANLEDSLKQKSQVLQVAQLAASVGEEHFDITLPGYPFPGGRLHPITQTLYEVCDIFRSMGFQVVEGPEVEWDYYNF